MHLCQSVSLFRNFLRSCSPAQTSGSRRACLLYHSSDNHSNMKSLIATIAVCSAFICVAQATRVRNCETGEDYNDNSQIKISNCEEPPCKLKRKTQVVVEFKFTPEQDILKGQNSVHANIVGIPFPFIGVDGTNACETIFNTDGSKAACPLTAGTEYVYKNHFKILDIYPKISLTVHWAIVDTNANKEVLCFEVDAKITS